MAARDIMPFKSPHGGTTTVKTGSMTANEVFEVGEPVMVVDAGTITEPTDDAAQWTVAQMDIGMQCGIACFGPGASNINPRTGVAFATADEVAFWPANEGTLFITSNVFAAGAGSASAPALTDMGESYQITYGTTDPIGWGVEKTAGVSGVDVQALIVDVLDAQLNPISRSGNTGVYVVFEIIATLGAA